MMVDEDGFFKQEMPVGELLKIKRESYAILIAAYNFLKDGWRKIYEGNLCITESMISLDKVLEFYLPSLYAIDQQLAISVTESKVTKDLIIIGEKCEVSRAVFENYLKNHLCDFILDHKWYFFKKMMDNGLEGKVSEFCEKQLGEGKYECSDGFIKYVWSTHKECRNLEEVIEEFENKGAPANIVDLYYDKQNKAIVVDAKGNKATLYIGDNNKQIAANILESSGMQILDGLEAVDIINDKKLTLQCNAKFSSKNNEYEACAEIALQHQKGGNELFHIIQGCYYGVRMSDKSIICRLYTPEVAYGDGVYYALPSEESQSYIYDARGGFSKFKYPLVGGGIASIIYGVFKLTKHNSDNKGDVVEQQPAHDHSSAGDNRDNKHDYLANMVLLPGGVHSSFDSSTYSPKSSFNTLKYASAGGGIASLFYGGLRMLKHDASAVEQRIEGYSKVRDNYDNNCITVSNIKTKGITDIQQVTSELFKCSTEAGFYKLHHVAGAIMICGAIATIIRNIAFRIKDNTVVEPPKNDFLKECVIKSLNDKSSSDDVYGDEDSNTQVDDIHDTQNEFFSCSDEMSFYAM